MYTSFVNICNILQISLQQIEFYIRK